MWCSISTYRRQFYKNIVHFCNIFIICHVCTSTQFHMNPVSVNVISNSFNTHIDTYWVFLLQHLSYCSSRFIFMCNKIKYVWPCKSLQDCCTWYQSCNKINAAIKENICFIAAFILLQLWLYMCNKCWNLLHFRIYCIFAHKSMPKLDLSCNRLQSVVNGISMKC